MTIALQSRTGRRPDNLSTNFILTCLHGRRDGRAMAAAGRLAAQAGLDWDQVQATAARHRVSELLYDAVRGTDLVPAPFEQALADVYERTFCRNLFLLHELQQLTRQLAALDLDLLVLKGAALATTVYRTIGLRPMVDLDLLVHRRQVPAIVAALLGRGYEQDVEPRPGAALTYENEVSLRKPGLETVRIDLHWSLFDSLFYQERLDLAWYWQTSRVQSYGEGTLRVPGPEAQLIHLCGHLAYHHTHYPNLLWLNDLAEVVAVVGEALDWQLLVDKAGEMALVKPVREYLGQIAAAWPTPIPKAALARLRAEPISTAEQRAYDLHTAKREGSLPSRVLPDLLELPPGKPRLAFIWAKLVPRPDYMRSRYHPPHDAALPLLYAYHFGVGLLTAAALLARGAWNRRPGRPRPPRDGELLGKGSGGGPR